MPEPEELFPEPLSIDTRIYTIRGQQVMLDSDLAEVYEVTTSQLNQAVNRNERRFPTAFSFQLTQNEWDILRSQFVISNVGRGGRRHLPRVFTEHGAVMLASVLNSDRAVAASIQVVQAFVRLHRVLASNRELSHRVDELSQKVHEHDASIAVIFREIEDMALSGLPEVPEERIGFKVPK